jgi:hypothetical protein
MLMIEKKIKIRFFIKTRFLLKNFFETDRDIGNIGLERIGT